ncbi:MAG: hypothetical protein PVF54_06650 [Anaerolineae bacterium]|jgi:hypothetical protein
MSDNLLRNGEFEADWSEGGSHRCLVVGLGEEVHEKEVGNVFTPPGWLTWFRHESGSWGQPEVQDVWKSRDPGRVQTGTKAATLFTSDRKHDAGFLQRVPVEPGAPMQLTAYAHAWSNHSIVGHEDCTDDPRCSCGVGAEPAFLLTDDMPSLSGDPWKDAIANVSFRLGIDPTGGVNPYAETVVWGPGASIYNEHHPVPAVAATAEAGTVTVFLRSKTLWAFKHNDVYWDGAKLVFVEEAPEPDPEPDPEPKPEPEPRPETEPHKWDYSVVSNGSRIGVHAIQPNGVPSFAEDLVDGGTRFPVVKAVDDVGWLPGVKEISPDSITIARLVLPNEGCSGVEDRSFSLEAHAEASLAKVMERIGSDPRLADAVDYWEVYNEPDPPGAEGYRQLAQLQIVTMDVAEREGLRLALFSLNAGTPEWNEMQAMVETGVFARAKQGGHILALHEGTFDTHDPTSVWGDRIPGSPKVEGAGPLNFRYRYLYHLLRQRDEVIPVVISEWYCGDEQSASAETLVDALKWYDSEASKDYYFWGVCPFTLGPTSRWRHSDYGRVYRGLIGYMIGVRDRQNAASPREELEGPECVPPRIPYRRNYILLPQQRDSLDRLDWRTAVAIGSSETMQTLGHSAHDSGVGPPERWVTAINPDRWGEDLRSWYEKHYSGLWYRAIEAKTPWEVAIHLMPKLEGDFALGQGDARWRSYDFGEGLGGGTIGRYGSLLTGLTMVLCKVYRRSVTPPRLDKLLVTARAAYVDDNVLVWQRAVSLFSAFDDSIKDELRRSAEDLRTLLNGGWEIILRRVSTQGSEEQRFDYLESVEGGVLHVIDTSDGERKQAAAEDYEGMRAAHLGRASAKPSFELVSGNGELPDVVPPRVPYDRTYVLLPGFEEDMHRLEWRAAAAIGSSDAMQTVGHSADDAGVGPSKRCIVAVNPDLWPGDLKAWYDIHYPGANYRVLEAENPWEMALKLLPELEEDIALAQVDRRWADYDFGEHPDVGEETIGRYGCFLTGLAMTLRKVYRRDITPAVLDRILVAARSAYVKDNLMAWASAVRLFPAFDDDIKDNSPRSATELAQLLGEGWEIILRRADGGHFVYLENVEDDLLHIIDSWDGKRKQEPAVRYAGIRAAHLRGRIVPEAPAVLVGLHDEAGGEWMVDQRMAGCCLVHRSLQRQSIRLDFRHLSDKGIVVLGRLNWGYADGAGTYPRPAHKEAFVDAVAATILTSKGVDYFHIGSEPNNQREWPRFESGDRFPLTPEYATEIYNEVWQRVHDRAKIGPPPIDPYYGPGSNSREWWTHILRDVDGADVLFLHGTTQTNDSNDIWSRARFSDWPLEWQYMNLRAIETSLEVVPERFRQLPVFVTELNPRRVEPSGDAGWQPGNDEWVRQAVRYFREEQPVTGAVFYRYETAGPEAPFGLRNRPVILDAIRKESELSSMVAATKRRQRPRGILPCIWRRVVEAQG